MFAYKLIRFTIHMAKQWAIWTMPGDKLTSLNLGHMIKKLQACKGLS